MPKSRSTDLALVAVFAALTAVCSLTPAIPIGVGVPITLQTFAVSLCGLVLGPWRGFLATALYVVVGLAGLPVFAQGGAGAATLAMPSAGYLLSFPLMALVTGLGMRWSLARGRERVAGKLVACALVGSLLINQPAGIAGMVVNAHVAWSTALVAGAAFVPGDVLKCVLAGLVAAAVHRAFPALLASPKAASA